MPKKPPEALVPMDRLKEIVKGIIAVPRAEIDAADRERRERPKRQRKSKKQPKG